jgi:transcriptional regulator with XRE-family HTH domain
LPFCHWTLRGAIPRAAYPKALNTLGDHILKRQLDLGLTQKAAAKLIGVHPASLVNWEKGRTEIEVRFYPALIEFLGYNPLPGPRTRGEAVRQERMARGLSVGRLAAMVGVYPITVSRIEVTDRA